jgi:hypothetical protein
LEKREKVTLIQHIVMRNIIPQIIGFQFIAAWLLAQNPPLTGNPYAPRGKARSPDGNYEWIVKEKPTIRYELIQVATGKAIAVVRSYYSLSDEMNIRYAKAFGAYWNRDSSVVALDELNRRRAGYLYFFILAGGKAQEHRAEQFVPIPKTVDEARLVVDPGWVSATKIRLRLAEKSRDSNPTSKFYLIDFSNPENPSVQPAQ